MYPKSWLIIEIKGRLNVGLKLAKAPESRVGFWTLMFYSILHYYVVPPSQICFCWITEITFYDKLINSFTNFQTPQWWTGIDVFGSVIIIELPHFPLFWLSCCHIAIELHWLFFCGCKGRYTHVLLLRYLLSSSSIVFGSCTFRPQAEVDGLTKEVSETETDYGLFRADGMYSRAILHHCGW